MPDPVNDQKQKGATLTGQATQQSPSPSVSALTGECPSRWATSSLYAIHHELSGILSDVVSMWPNSRLADKYADCHVSAWGIIREIWSEAAQAIEARQGRDNVVGSVADESAVAESDAPDRIKALLTQVETLTRELEGTDPYAADPSKWGLRAVCRGLAEQRDAAEARALTAEAERDALRDQLFAAHRALEPFGEDAWSQLSEDDRTRRAWRVSVHVNTNALRAARSTLRSARSLLHTEKTGGDNA
jgi:hypothetical protein